MRKKTAKLLLEVALSLFGLFVFCFALLLARLSLGPINLDFLTPKMEAALQPVSSQFKASIDHTQLVWRDWKHPCEIELVNFCIHTPQKPEWLKIEHIGISPQFYKLLGGELQLKHLRLYHPKVLLERDENGQYLVEFMDSSRPEQEFSFKELAPLLTLSATDPSLGKLNDIRKISIVEAQVTLREKRTSQQWTLPHTTLTLNRYTDGFKIDLILTPLSGKKEKIHAHINHSLGKPSTELSVHLHSVIPQTLIGENRLTFSQEKTDALPLDALLDTFQHWNLPLNGKVTLSLNPTTLHLLKGQGNVDFGKGNLDLSIANLRPLPLEAGNISFTISPHEILLSNASFLSEEMLLQLSGKLSSPDKPLTLSEGLTVGQELEFTGKVEDFLVDHLAAIWPQTLAVPARDWLTKNLRKGLVTKATFLLKALGTETGLSVETLEGTILGEGAEITYLEGMPAVEDIKASATFSKKGFDITVVSGHTKGIEVQEGKVLIKDLDTDDENLSLEVKGKGPLSDLLDTLNHKPLEFATYAGIDPKKVKGKGTLTLRLDFPLLKSLTFKDVKMKFQGAFKDISLERDVFGMFTASLAKGTMTAEGTEERLILRGTSAINQIPSSVIYTQYFASSFPTEFQLHITASPFIQDLKRLGFDYDTYGKGPLKATLLYTHQRNKTGKLAMNFDATQAKLHFAPLQWHKKIGERSLIGFDLLFEHNTLSKLTNIKVDSPPYALQGEMLFAPGKNVKKLHLSQLKGPFTDTQVTLHSPGKDTFDVSFKGKSLNLENFLAYLEEEGEEKNYPSTDIKLSAHVEHLRFGEGKVFQNVEATADLFLEGKDTFWREVNLLAKAGDATGSHGAFSKKRALSHNIPGGILLHLTPQPNNVQTLTVNANDAGQFLRNLSIYDDIRGGQLSIKAERTNYGPFEGVFKLENFDAHKVPLLARFAAVLSPIGIVNLFSESQNLSLEKFKCKFVFGKELLMLRDGVGKSMSLGFTVSGKLDRLHRQYTLQGNIIPARFLNSFLSNIPGLGNLLNGGKGEGLFGLAYKVTGSFDSPEVSVNPLSLLAPGFLRNLFSSEGG